MSNLAKAWNGKKFVPAISAPAAALTVAAVAFSTAADATSIDMNTSFSTTVDYLQTELISIPSTRDITVRELLDDDMTALGSTFTNERLIRASRLTITGLDPENDRQTRHELDDTLKAGQSYLFTNRLYIGGAGQNLKITLPELAEGYDAETDDAYANNTEDETNTLTLDLDPGEELCPTEGTLGCTKLQIYPGTQYLGTKLSGQTDIANWVIVTPNGGPCETGCDLDESFNNQVTDRNVRVREDAWQVRGTGNYLVPWEGFSLTATLERFEPEADDANPFGPAEMTPLDDGYTPGTDPAFLIIPSNEEPFCIYEPTQP